MTLEQAPRALMLAGKGRYQDPWHDHAATSQTVAVMLHRLGLDVQVRGTVPEAFTGLETFGLIVVNSGRSSDQLFVSDLEVQSWVTCHEALHQAAIGGTAVLGLHQAANTFPDSDRWPAILGGRWVPGVSTHPPYGDAVLDAAGEHPIVTGDRRRFTVDERYCNLQISPDSQVLLTHRHQGIDHPLAWVHQRPPYRVVYDGLGHDVTAYGTRARQELFEHEVNWLIRERA